MNDYCIQCHYFIQCHLCGIITRGCMSVYCSYLTKISDTHLLLKKIKLQLLGHFDKINPAYHLIFSTKRQWTLNLTCWISLNVWDYECTFKTNVHSRWMFATSLALLPHCGHSCHILIMIASLWPCLPHFDYDCHSVHMFATFRLIATLWACLSHF